MCVKVYVMTYGKTQTGCNFIKKMFLLSSEHISMFAAYKDLLRSVEVRRSISFTTHRTQYNNIVKRPINYKVTTVPVTYSTLSFGMTLWAMFF
jgi:hypothetical protein